MTLPRSACQFVLFDANSNQDIETRTVADWCRVHCSGQAYPTKQKESVNWNEQAKFPPLVNGNYQGNYERLLQVKNRYDPNNLFRLNANITPTVQRS